MVSWPCSTIRSDPDHPKEASMRRSILVLATIVALLAAASEASAQWFVDGYVGASLTSQDTITFTTFGVEREQDADFKSSSIFGARLGKWFDALPWLGLAGDVSYFRASADLHVFPITALVMARYGLLRDDEFKHGRLQPYAGVGGGLFISHLDGSIGFLEASDTSADIGLDVRLGVAYHFETSWAGFFEYRFTHTSPTYTVEPFGGSTPGDTTLSTNHFILGVSYRF
jgi:opacity protein-like surface antigen